MNKKRIFKLAVAFVALVILWEIIMQISVHNSPERKVAEQFILQNDEIKNIFGGNLQTQYSKEGAEIVKFSNRTEYEFRFKVEGKKGDGFVSALGEKSENQKFKVNKIVTSNDFEQSQVIWPTKHVTN